jgi:hypothetical protein
MKTELINESTSYLCLSPSSSEEVLIRDLYKDRVLSMGKENGAPYSVVMIDLILKG